MQSRMEAALAVINKEHRLNAFDSKEDEEDLCDLQFFLDMIPKVAQLIPIIPNSCLLHAGLVGNREWPAQRLRQLRDHADEEKSQL